MNFLLYLNIFIHLVYIHLFLKKRNHNICLNCLNGLKDFEIVHQGVAAHDCLAFKGEEDVLKKKNKW